MAGLHNANAAAGIRLASPAHGGYRATVQTTDTPTPPPPTQGARQPGWGERRGPREHPGERVGARGRGRGRSREWHTRVTALHGQGGQTCRQGRQREGEWDGRQAREGAQGSGIRVARTRAEGTRRARRSSKEREHRTTKKKKTAGQADTQEGHIEEAGRGRWGEQGANEGAKEHIVSQRDTMPMTRIEPYLPSRPTIRELKEGAAGGRGRRGSPPEGVSGEAAQVGLQVGRQGGGPETREGARDTTMARRRPAASTQSTRTTLRGRAGDRGKGRVERRESGYMYSNAG